MTTRYVVHFTKNAYSYVAIREEDVPQKVRFDVPLRHQGQMVEVAYGGFGRGEHDVGDTYRRITDASRREVRYAKREARS